MKILKITPENLKLVLKQAVLTIKKRGVIICPTDTVYGLIADAENHFAVKKIFKIKKRKINNPLPVFVKDLKAAKKLSDINKNQERFLKKFWPGQLTAVLKARFLKLPKGVISRENKIGLRVPNYKFLNLLLDKVNCPLVATSANISGKKASVKIVEILKQFEYKKNKPDLVIDAGNLKLALPSTIVDLIEFKVIRKGKVLKNQILKTINEIKL